MSVRAEILQFLRASRQFAQTLMPNDSPIWRQPQIAEQGDYALRDS